MKYFKWHLVVLAVFVSNVLYSQIPEGGIALIKDAVTNYQKNGKGILKVLTVTDQPFTKAFSYETGATVTNQWDEQLRLTADNDIETGDVILIAFYGKTSKSIQETGEGAVNVCIEHNTTYDKAIYQKVVIGNSWKQYFVKFVSEKTLTKAQMNVALHIGFASQIVEIADIKFLNYKKTLTIDKLPETEITYIGRDPNAAWRMEAQQRIEQIRKGNIEFTVLDKSGKPLPNAEVTINLEQHAFSFGSAIDATRFLSDKTYRQKVYELYNEVTFENDLKWAMWKSKTNHDYIKRALDSLDKHHIRVRGHVLVWPSFRYNPEYLKAYNTNPTVLSNEITKHINEVTQFTKGRLTDWDVINEPYDNHEWMDIIGTNDVMVDWFGTARKNEPAAKLFINDYSILSSGGTDKAHQDHYFNTIKFLSDKGVDFQGVGMQGHFSSDLTPITRLWTILDRFAVHGKTIKVTEFDIDLEQREVQADYTRDFMTALFAHKSVSGILSWGFWAGQHWKPKSAYYNTDWTIRPHGEEWRKFVFETHWTKNVTGITDASGKIVLNGYLGKYKVMVKANGEERSATFELKNSVESQKENKIQFSMDLGIIQNINDFRTGMINVAPNPFRESFEVDLQEINQYPVRIELTDLTGRLIKQTTAYSDGKILITPENDATFFILKVFSGNKVRVFKLIKG